MPKTASLSDTTVLIAGHGSSSAPETAQSVHFHVDCLKKRDAFKHVTCGFLKQAPYLPEVLSKLDAANTVVVPFMTSNGYVATHLMPKLLGPLSSHPGLTFADAIGTHPMIAQATASNISERIRLAGVCSLDAHLLIIGHSTRRNPVNERTTRKFMTDVQRQLPRGVSADVAFLEHAPLLSQWSTRTSRSAIFAVPFLMTGGFHGRVDVPLGLGLDPDSACVAPLQAGAAYIGPCRIHSRQVWLSRAVGFDPVMTTALESRIIETLAAQNVAA